MKQYFFHLLERGSLLADEEGQHIGSDDEAHRLAVRFAREIIAHDAIAGRLALNNKVIVTDAGGRERFCVQLADAVTIDG